MAGTPNVTLRLSNRPENVLLVRQAINGLADALGLDPLDLNDINTAVTEACNNVVLHAYDGGEGPLEVDLCLGADDLEVSVRDSGRGIAPSAQPDGPVDGGIGLPVMHALASDVQLHDRDGSGTDVEMRFALTGLAGVPDAPAAGVAHEDRLTASALADSTLLTVAPAPLARAVLPRVLSSLAARAHFSTDRIADTQLLADSVLSSLDGSVSGERLGFGIAVAPRELELRLGPLHAGRGDALIEAARVDGVGPVIERLVDDHEVAPAGDEVELLALRMEQQR